MTAGSGDVVLAGMGASLGVWSTQATTGTSPLPRTPARHDPLAHFGDVREYALFGSVAVSGTVDFKLRDFNGADTYFDAAGSAEWNDLSEVLAELRPHLQASDQKGKVGAPIFDPKGTNAALTALAKERGWLTVPVPLELTMFGNDWDAGRGSTLAEWQFSNYPFLWNNVIRTQAVIAGGVRLASVDETKALVVVTKGGEFPASNSTLYYEQAEAQLEAVFKTGAFSLPVRLIGLVLPEGAAEVDVVWTTYSARYGRAPETQEVKTMKVTGARNLSKYGVRRLSIRPA
jgi:hypothetical protein